MKYLCMFALVSERPWFRKEYVFNEAFAWAGHEILCLCLWLSTLSQSNLAVVECYEVHSLCSS